MDLYTRLAESNLLMDKDVGIIIFGRTNGGDQIQVTWAQIACVCPDLPEGVQVRGFDPDNDIVATWRMRDKIHVRLLKMADRFAVCPMTEGGLSIQFTSEIIFIGQSEAFMDAVCGLMCALAQQPT